MQPFQPTTFFKNPHIQSICASTGPRKLLVRRQAQALTHSSQTIILDCGKGIRLQGEYSSQPSNSLGLVVLIHGWLGCNESLYLLSLGSTLFAEGYNIFRLNLRDHGDTGHLNKELFNSTRIDEVVNAVSAIQQQFPHDKNYLCGFSLGGNFSLRVAAHAPHHAIQLNQVVAVCPVINPTKTNRNLNDGPFIYHHYFRNKWRNSLLKKLQHFPEYDFGERLKAFKSLDEMNHYFVPNHTDYDNVADYLQGYSIGGEYLAKLEIPCHIVSTEDDPVIMAADLQELPKNKNLQIEVTRYGGHCGFIEGFSLNSWINQRISDILKQSA
jgi:predicted alpha/beta-fold hydrolase